MTEACMTPPTGAARELSDRVSAVIPRLETARLILRAPRLTDWPVLEHIWTTDRGIHIGGPMAPEEAWLDFNQLIAGWVLRGHGALTVTDKAGTVLGMVLLGHEWGDPEPELGWLLTADAEGHGYAEEAAMILRDWGRAHVPGGFVSYIADANTRSLTLAAKLGGKAHPDPHPADASIQIFRFNGEPS